MCDIVRESLLVHLGQPPEPALFGWLPPEALGTLVREYYAHDTGPSGKGRACGFICADCYNLFRTIDEDMERYCGVIRSADYSTCFVSDYFGAAGTIRLRRPLAYCCGSLVYQYTIPLYDAESRGKRVVGAFIDGQMRPDPPLLSEVRYLGLPDSLIEHYKSVAPLTQERAQGICNYLRGTFADRLEELSRRRIDTARFREDVDRLEVLLSHLGARRPIETVWQLLEEGSPVSLHSVMVPLVDAGDVLAAGGRGTYESVTFIPRLPNTNSRHLRFLTAMHVSEEERQALREVREFAREAEGTHQILSASNGLRSLAEVLRENLGMPFVSFRKAMSGQPEAGAETQWVNFPAVADGELSTLCLHLGERDIQDQKVIDAAVRTSQAFDAYLRRCKVARGLYRVMGNGSRSELAAAEDLEAVTADIRELHLAAQHLPALGKWIGLLSLLLREMEACKPQAVMAWGGRSPLGDCLASAISAPVFERAAVGACEMLLSERPFSSRASRRTRPQLQRMMEVLGPAVSPEQARRSLREIENLLRELRGS
jgi:hypothetical protein